MRMKKIILSSLLICSFALFGTAQVYEKDYLFANMLIEQTGDQDFSLYVNIKNPSKYKKLYLDQKHKRSWHQLDDCGM